MEKVKSSKTLYKIISVLIAIILWVFVSYQETPTSHRWIKNVPVTIVGADVLDQNGLYVVATDRSTVDVRVEGNRSDLSKVVAGDITARLDVSALEAAGNASLTCDVTVDRRNVEVTGARHSSILVTAEKISTDLFPVSAELTGSPAAGYRVFEPSVYPTEVSVRGAESLVHSVASVSTKSVSVSRVTRGNTVNVGLTAYDENGKVIPDVTFEPSSVEVSYTVLREKSVPLNIPAVNVPAGKTVSFDQTTVKIYGSAAALSGVSEISAEPVDASALSDGDEISVSLALPEGIYASDEAGTLNVRVVMGYAGSTGAVGETDADEKTGKNIDESDE